MKHEIDSVEYSPVDPDKSIWLGKDEKIFFIFPLREQQELENGSLRVLGLSEEGKKLTEFKVFFNYGEGFYQNFEKFEKLLSDGKGTLTVPAKLKMIDIIEKSLSYDFEVVGPEKLLPY